MVSQLVKAMKRDTFGRESQEWSLVFGSEESEVWTFFPEAEKGQFMETRSGLQLGTC